MTRPTKLFDVLVELGPQALLLERSDEPLRATIAGRLTGERGAVCDAEPRKRPLEVS
jgi:hypothetical protein